MNDTPRLIKDTLKNILVALVCLPVAHLGLSLTIEPSSVSPLWPMTGLALAILLLFGRRFWAGIWLADFIHNLLNQTPILASAGIASGSTLTALLGAYLLREKVDLHFSLARVRDVLNFVTLGVILTPIISATVGVSFLYFYGLIPLQNYATDLLIWWVGDAMGILIVTPVVLIWSQNPHLCESRRRFIEGVLLSGLLVLVCLVVFSQGIMPRTFYPLAYLIFPFLIWGALRFDQQMVVTLTLIVALIALIETAQQFNSYTASMIWSTLLFLLAYIATTAITSMLLAAVLSERREIERSVTSLEERFSKAFHAAPVAIWISTIADEMFVDVNEEFCKLMGYSREEVVGKSSVELQLWETPDVRPHLIALLEILGTVPQMDVCLRPKSGEMLCGLISSDLIELAGEPHLLHMFYDLTERMETENALRESEERYRQLFEGVDDAVFVHDMDANILDVNEATGRRLGYSRDELLHMKVTELDLPEFAAGFQERLRQQLEQGFLNQIEGVQLAKNGRKVFIDINSKLITYRGKPAILAVDRDITERKLAEEKLRESEARYRAVVEDQTEMICRYKRDGTITFVNDAYCRYFGKTQEELIGSNFLPLIHPDDQHSVEESIHSLTGENPVSTSENRTPMPDGSLRWHQWTDHAILNEAGEVIEYQSVGKDVTQLKEIEAQRLTMALEHERVQILADFIAAASHDFRTPLSVINTSAYLLQRTNDAEQRSRHFQQIQEQTYHIERLIDGLLTMSRLDRGNVFRFKPVDVNSLIQQIEVHKRPQMEERLLQLKVELDWQIPQIDLDEGWMYRCLIQLIENAIHFTPEGGTITVRSLNEVDQVVITVSDTGVGIEPGDLPHIFKRLFRGEVHRPVGGQGLGLSIAAKIVEAHEGKIEVESQPGVGSTFRVVLPLKHSDKNEGSFLPL